MQITDEIIERVQAAVPGATLTLVRTVANALLTSQAQIIFVQGDGREMVDGESHYPDSLQLVVNDPHVAADLARQLSLASSNGTSTTVLLAGQAEFSE